MESNKDEFWKPLNLEGVPSGYEVSNLGRIRSIKITYIKTQIVSGYERFCTQQNYETKAVLVHRAVAKAFVDNPDNKPQVNHKDANKLNNLPENLEWVTRSENQLHAYQNGLQKDSSNDIHWSLRLSEEDLINLKTMIDNNHSFRKVGKLYKMTRSQVYTLYQRLKKEAKAKEVFGE